MADSGVWLPRAVVASYKILESAWLACSSESWADRIASASSPFADSRALAIAASRGALSEADSLPSFSLISFSVWKQSASARLRDSANRCFCLSSSACTSASFRIRSISDSFKPLDCSIFTVCSLLEPRSLALTARMPLASMSNFTSIWGVPRGADGMPSRLNWPRSRLSLAIGRSPWNTLTVTAVCPSAAVLKTCLRSVGTVVLRSTSLVNKPPSVSIPSDSGVTSSSSTSVTSPPNTPP